MLEMTFTERMEEDLQLQVSWHGFHSHFYPVESVCWPLTQLQSRGREKYYHHLSAVAKGWY